MSLLREHVVRVGVTVSAMRPHYSITTPLMMSCSLNPSTETQSGVFLTVRLEHLIKFSFTFENSRSSHSTVRRPCSIRVEVRIFPSKLES